MIDLWEGAIPINTRQFWARVSIRQLSAGIKPQETMRLYTIAFQCEVSNRAKGTERETWRITPITVQVMHLLAPRKVLIQYSLVEPDRCEQSDTLSEREMQRIVPNLSFMVKHAMQNAGINLENCSFEVQCIGSNLVRDRGHC